MSSENRVGPVPVTKEKKNLVLFHPNDGSVGVMDGRKKAVDPGCVLILRTLCHGM